MFIGIAWFVQYVWEIMICVDYTRILNQCQVCAYSINKGLSTAEGGRGHVTT